MTDDQLAGYCGVILLYMAKGAGGHGLSVPRDEIDERICLILDRQIDRDVVRSAVRMLNRCDISYIEDDPITGSFIRISADKFASFIEAVSRDQATYNQIVDDAEDPNSGINAAERRPFRYLELYNRYDALRKYAQFGDDWAALMIEKLKAGFAFGDVVPASDRVVMLSDNSPEVAEIVASAQALHYQLTTGNDLGKLTPEQAQAAASEVAEIRTAFSGQAVRANLAYQRARDTLEWIGKEAGGALVGTAATALLLLIAKFLGF